MKWTVKKLVAPTDLDINNVASASAFFRYMQEAAHLQMLGMPPTPDELYSQNKAFVLSRCALSVYKTLRACEEIEVATWACPGHACAFPRCVRVTRNGETVAEMQSQWALLNFADGTLSPHNEYPHDFSPEPSCKIPQPLRFRFPKDAIFSECGNYKVKYSDVDFNKHLNNTRYPDLFCSFLPTMENLQVKNMAISYLKEAHIGAELQIFVAKLENGYGFRSLLENGEVNAEAFFELAEII